MFKMTLCLLYKLLLHFINVRNYAIGVAPLYENIVNTLSILFKIMMCILYTLVS